MVVVVVVSSNVTVTLRSRKTPGLASAVMHTFAVSAGSPGLASLRYWASVCSREIVTPVYE